MKTSLTLLLFISIRSVFSQTGPAGVGTNTTSAQQNRVWYKADIGVYNDAGATLAGNGDPVQQWNDQSGVGNNGVQSNSTYRPTYRANAVNGLPALNYNGSQFVTAGAFPGIANNVGYTYIVVFKDTAYIAGALNDGAGDYIIDRGLPGAESNELAALKISNTNKYRFQKRDGGGGGLGGPLSTSGVNTANFQVVDYRQVPGSTKVYDLFIDGLLESTVSSADVDYTPPVPQVGHHYQPSFGGIRGYISEFILYNYNVNDAQMNILNSYLAAKYGLALASNDKYTGDNIAKGDYDFEVAGVGQEATGGNMSAASSITGGLEATQSTTLEAGEYLLFGHQAGSNFVNCTDIAGISAGPAVCRWNRIWYLDWTHVGGTTETVDLTFDLSDAGTPGTPAAPLSNYKLIYRTGTAGSWTEISSAASIIGDRITFTGVPYTTGNGYYTIATLDNSNSVLPIGLIAFRAEICNDNICLSWSTATEANNNYFTVERSDDGMNFKKVAVVKGAGTSNHSLAYSVEDTPPATGLLYYHLKQTDFDGSYVYSPIEAVDFKSPKDLLLMVYPSPNNGLFEVQLSGSARLLICDAMGNLVFDEVAGPGKRSIDIQQRPNGIYFLKFISSGQPQTVKFFKQ